MLKLFILPHNYLFCYLLTFFGVYIYIYIGVLFLCIESYKFFLNVRNQKFLKYLKIIS